MHRKKANSSFELKSSSLSLITLTLKTPDIDLISKELRAQFGEQSNYFEDEPAILDLGLLESDTLNLPNLLNLLSNYQLKPFAVANAKLLTLQNMAKQAGLILLPDSITTPNEPVHTPDPTAAAATTLFTDKPLRSGQQIYARDADLIVSSLVSNGAEVLADGNIHVYAPLRGRAIAGAQGNTHARIFTTCFEPTLYSIAGVFQTTEQGLAQNIWGKPVMVHLENNALILTPL